jgi:DNA-binding winged helix-turn-helix (wHTH) protein/TolB-like protein/Tfp pilus assembly protein PilF
MELKAGSLYECGPFRLEPGEHRLTREGNPVPLPPKAFDLLVFLVRNQGRLVTKDEIMHAVWPDSFVEEANLTVSISVLRKILGEKNSDLRFIETVPKRGYRFTASVRELTVPQLAPEETADVWPEPAEPGQPDETLPPEGNEAERQNGADQSPAAVTDEPVVPSKPASTKRRVALLAVAALICLLAVTGYFLMRRKAAPAQPLLTARSLAILPLRNLQQDRNEDFLGFSLADAVITKLSAISSLTVRPSSAIEKYKNETIDLPKVATDLNVDTLLTGNFIREGRDLRITYQLVDAKTEKILGRDTINLKYDNLLAVQDKVVEQIIKGLALNLSPAEAQLIKADEPGNPLAYEYYLRGVDLVGSHDFPMAIKMLEKSAEMDPKYALTWAYLGQSYTSSATFELGGRDHYRKAQAAYERALALQPKQIEANMFLANLLIDTGKVEEAMPLLREALKTNPNHAAVHWELGYAYRFAGLLQESVAECEHARQIDSSVKSNGSALNAYLYLGEYDKFLQSLPDENNSAFIVFYRGFGEYHQKKFDLAASDFDRAYGLDPTLYTGIGKAFSDAITGKNADGLALLHQLVAKIEQRGVGDPEATYKIAEGFGVLGDKASAMLMLRTSIENGFFPYPYLVADPLLESIRNEQEFGRLMNIARERHTAFINRFF